MVTGSKASFNHTVHRLYGHMQQKMDKKRVELLEVEGVANVIEEKVQVLTIYIQRRITLVVPDDNDPMSITTKLLSLTPADARCHDALYSTLYQCSISVVSLDNL